MRNKLDRVLNQVIIAENVYTVGEIEDYLNKTYLDGFTIIDRDTFINDDKTEYMLIKEDVFNETANERKDGVLRKIINNKFTNIKTQGMEFFASYINYDNGIIDVYIELSIKNDVEIPEKSVKRFVKFCKDLNDELLKI